jgi:hypothetical protein
MRGENQPSGTVYYIEAPFKGAEDFSKIENSGNRRVEWPESRLLIVRFNNSLAAYQSLPEWGFKQRTKDLGQAIVDARVGMVWASE